MSGIKIVRYARGDCVYASPGGSLYWNPNHRGWLVLVSLDSTGWVKSSLLEAYLLGAPDVPDVS